MNAIISFFNKPLLKLPLIFGLITAVLCFLYFITLHLIGIVPTENKRTLEFGINLIMMATAVWYYRKNYRNDTLHIWEGLMICYIVNIVATIVSGWLVYGFVTLINPDVFLSILKEAHRDLIANKAVYLREWGNDMYQNAVQNVMKTQPEDMISRGLIWKSLITIFVAPIISLIFRKQNYSVFNPKG
jgi:Protein of unknown function (DUF4199)